MKTILTTLALFFICFFSNAQIFGSNDVCAGYTYSYSASIVGAATYSWSFPPGWYDIAGQGTGTVTATCNVNTGDIYCEGIDAGGNSIETLVLVTQFGGGSGSGWDVQPPSVSGCNGTLFTVSVVPNGTGGGTGCPAGCGNGTPHSNIHYALYNNIWPLGTFLSFADGITTNTLGFNVSSGPTYVYQVDITNGFDPPQAVQIEGGCGGGTVNNICMITIFAPIPPSFSQSPPAPCIGDTVRIYETSGVFNPCWGCVNTNSGLNVIGSTWANPLVAIVTNSTPTADVTGIDANGCITYDFYNVSTSPCTVNSLSGDTVVCSGHTYGYTANIPGAFTYNWTLPSGWYDLSGQGTANITATCNANAGNICVEGFDASNNSLGTTCITTQFGGGGNAGWDVSPSSVYSCLANPAPFTLQITPNGTGGGAGCPAGCGSGALHPNIVFAVYNNVWPTGNFVQYADGVSLIVSPGVNTTYYVYQVDVTNGLNPPQAILISGGCGGGTVNNSVSVNVIWPTPPSISSYPNPACVGDTVTVYDGTGLINSYWNVSSGGILLNNNIWSIDVIITGNPCDVYLEGLDPNTYCFTATTYSPLINCNAATISGDSIVCAGHTYNYSASIPGAINYTWTFPAGWYGITGQGTANVSATCNINDGNICVEGFDGSGNSLGTECILTQFGGGGFSGWDVQPSSVSGCTGMPFTVSIVPNGTGGGPGCLPGCGNGTLHPNIVYGIYSNTWPNGYLLGYADGFSTMFFGGFGGPAYVYLVDVTNGINPPQAIKIEGGCGSGVVNNVCLINPYMPVPPSIIQTPSLVCIGDTIQITELTGVQNPGWGFMAGNNDLQLLSSQYSNPLIAIVTGNNPTTDLTGIDFNGCPTGIPFIQVALGTCAVPVVQFASSDTVFCDKQSVDFTDLSTNNPTSWQWSFPGAAPATSTDQNPQGIYYATSGSFDVTLIACNAAGCDTITLNNFIVEYLSPTDSIFELNDTLFSFPASNYQWYEVGSGIISGATGQYYVPTQAGNYYCSIADSVGCSGISNTIAITTGILQISNSNFPISIIPNPGNGIFKLEINATSKIKNLETQIKIINVLGEIVFEKGFENVSGKFSHQINLTSQPKGIYVLKLIINGKIYTQKIIIN